MSDENVEKLHGEWQLSKLRYWKRDDLVDAVCLGSINLDTAYNEALSSRLGSKAAYINVSASELDWAADVVLDGVHTFFGPRVVWDLYQLLQDHYCPLPDNQEEPAKRDSNKYPVDVWRQATLDYLRDCSCWVKTTVFYSAVLTDIDKVGRTYFRRTVLESLIESGEVERRGDLRNTEYRIGSGQVKPKAESRNLNIYREAILSSLTNANWTTAPELRKVVGLNDTPTNKSSFSRLMKGLVESGNVEFKEILGYNNTKSKAYRLKKAEE